MRLLNREKEFTVLYGKLAKQEYEGARYLQGDILYNHGGYCIDDLEELAYLQTPKGKKEAAAKKLEEARINAEDAQRVLDDMEPLPRPVGRPKKEKAHTATMASAAQKAMNAKKKAVEAADGAAVGGMQGSPV